MKADYVFFQDDWTLNNIHYTVIVYYPTCNTRYIEYCNQKITKITWYKIIMRNNTYLRILNENKVYGYDVCASYYI